ncbi:MAG: ATPase, partial [Zymomonas mobilis subsp. pomaceae]
MTEFPKRHFLLWEKQREQIAHDLKACQAGIYDDKMLNRLEAVATHLGKEAADSGDEAFASLAQHLAQLLTYLQNDKLVLNLFLIDLIQRSFEAIEAYITALNSGLSLPDHAKLDTELQENLASSSEWALKKVGVDIATDAPSDSPTISLPLIRPPSKATPDGQCINQSVAESSIYVEGSNLPHIPIDPDKLDGLFKIFNEMLSIRASLSEGNASNIESRNQDNDLDKLDDLIQSANNYTLSLQTQKIEGLFSQIIPIIEHRYAQKNKFITFSIIGGDTKIDKRIVISVGEALLELVDNAALHGIESAEDRQKVSKPENGRICLEAKCHASRLRIAITDDGRGII